MELDYHDTPYGTVHVGQFRAGAWQGGVLFDPIVKVRLYWESAVGIAIALLGLTLGAGLYPAVSASRVPPIEVVKAA